MKLSIQDRIFIYKQYDCDDFNAGNICDKYDNGIRLLNKLLINNITKVAATYNSDTVIIDCSDKFLDSEENVDLYNLLNTWNPKGIFCYYKEYIEAKFNNLVNVEMEIKDLNANYKSFYINISRN